MAVNSNLVMSYLHLKGRKNDPFLEFFSLIGITILAPSFFFYIIWYRFKNIYKKETNKK